MDPKLLWFGIWTGVLAALLFFPVSKLIWVVSVRRLERKFDKKLTDDEISGQLRRARFISVIVCIFFAALFNYNVFGFGGAR